MKPLIEIFQETIDIQATPLCQVLGKTRKPEFVGARHRFWASAAAQGYLPVTIARRFRVNHSTVGQAILKQKNGIGYLGKFLRSFGLNKPGTKKAQRLVSDLEKQYQSNHPSREYQRNTRAAKCPRKNPNPNASSPEGQTTKINQSHTKTPH